MPTKKRLFLLLAITWTLFVLMIVGFWYQPGWLVAVRMTMSLLLIAGVAREALNYRRYRREHGRFI